MCSYKPTVMLWLRRTHDADQVRRVRDELAGQPGVMAVLSSARNSRLVLVQYDEHQTTSQQLLRVARERDHTALLVGI